MRITSFLLPLVLSGLTKTRIEAKDETVTQKTIDYIAANVKAGFHLKDNYVTYKVGYAASISLHNTGGNEVTAGNWSIYFGAVQWIESEYLKKGIRFESPANFYVEHVQGYLFRLGPNSLFHGLGPDKTVNLDLKFDGWTVSRFEQMPNWYVSAPGLEARTLNNTQGEGLKFVSPYTTPEQVKRAKDDLVLPWSPSERYERNSPFQTPLTQTPPVTHVIPLPAKMVTQEGSLSLVATQWTVLYGQGLEWVAIYFKETLTLLKKEVGLTIAPLTKTSVLTNTIQLRLGQVDALKDVTNSTEGYSIHIRTADSMIEVISPSTGGAFYGAVTLLHLAMQPGKEGHIPECHVLDYPRFAYRGMHADVARNFLPKKHIVKLLDVMALYKLNKFHFHLTDDEGWRLEIPGLDELTQVGGQRCHDVREDQCVMSTLGSGPGTGNSGSGFYSVEDYKDILRHAKSRNIEVIPEFDMPGHSHAAIVAMKARRQRLLDLGKVKEASEYQLNDIEDTSKYFSVQMYNDNALNPCLNTTYQFIHKILQEVKTMHSKIQPLKIFNFGGDEVAHGAWKNSSACKELMQRGTNLKEYFTRKVSALTDNFTLAAWEDGLMDGGRPWVRSELQNGDVIAYAWNNVWEWGEGRRAYLLANSGFKVVLSPVTHTYFDQPNEPSPEERGFYWGTRYTDLFKTFSFKPDNYYSNADVTRLGHPVGNICAMHKGNGCPPLEKKENVIGMQGQLWSETVRLPSQFDYMVFPRLLALAERAWHKAPWEDKSRDQSLAELTEDKARFARALGSMHLALLDKLGVEYRVPPPGVRQVGDKIEANTEFPGLRVIYRLGKQSKWLPLKPTTTFASDQDVTFSTESADGKRRSSEIQIKTKHRPNVATFANLSISLLVFVFVIFLL